MTTGDDIARRKSDHLQAVLAGAGHAHRLTTGLERVRLTHSALPECNLGDIDLSSRFLGKHLRAPLLISSMTGGPEKAALINARLAAAAEAHGIAFAVGSQRIALDGGPDEGIGAAVRKAAPTIPIYANFGGAQLRRGYGRDEARRAVDMIGADALIIHLNPLQEAVQAGGDHGWQGLADQLEALVRGLGVPVIVKEVGFGISAAVARRLEAAGVAAIDVAGAGGTNWALVEGARAPGGREQAVAAAFADWGIPTADALIAVRAACPALPLIGSGGIRTGVEAAKAIRLGADLVGQAAGLLAAAVTSDAAAHDAIAVWVEQLRITCFCAGARDLTALRAVPLQGAPSPSA
jgi:isopentenyl-diphosphate delta-isomerase